MSMHFAFRDDRCQHVAQAWDHGISYDLQERGEKRYADRPHQALPERCIGDDAPHFVGCTALAHARRERSLNGILGSPDDLEFRSSTTLCAAVGPDARRQEAQAFEVGSNVARGVRNSPRPDCA